MATEIGTATDWLDLYNKLRDFLTPDATLVADGQEWTQIDGEVGALGNADEIVLQGPGLAGGDEIIVGITPVFDSGSDYFNLGFTGATMYNPLLGGITSQVNQSGTRYIYLWEDPIDYWFIANGRRFIIVARVSTNWFAAYCGFALPLELPAMWPYPLFVGATDSNAAGRWSNVAFSRKNFFDPGQNAARLMFPDVLWYTIANYTDVNESTPSSLRNTEPWHISDTSSLRENLDGSYLLQPARITCSAPYAAQMCDLQGVYGISGFGNTPGGLITIGLIDYLVVPNVYRTGINNMAAIKLD
jgi:hypothetical protein